MLLGRVLALESPRAREGVPGEAGESLPEGSSFGEAVGAKVSIGGGLLRPVRPSDGDVPRDFWEVSLVEDHCDMKDKTKSENKQRAVSR